MFIKKRLITSTPDTVRKNAKKYKIPYSKGFRGFKKFLMSVHGDETAERNNENLYNNDFSNSEIIFVCYTNEYKNRNAGLYIDGFRMGTVYDSDQVYAIEHGLIEQIHIEPKEEVVLGHKKTETRHRISVLVKYTNPNED